MRLTDPILAMSAGSRRPAFDDGPAAAAFSADDIARLRWSWRYLKPNADSLVALFEARLLRLAPGLRSALPGPVHGLVARERRRRLAAAVGAFLDNLEDLDALAPLLADLAQRLAGLGITTGARRPLREALLWTLRRGMGILWTPALERGWAGLADRLSGHLAPDETGPDMARNISGRRRRVA